MIPHRIHHAKSDEPGDPYGLHLGWLGSYLATETQQKTNRKLSAADYDRLGASLSPIGFINNSYEGYRRTGSVENVRHYFAHVLFAHVFWGGLAWLAVGRWGVWAWVSGVFLFSFIVRDFNYRGYSALTGTGKHGRPANHFAYGLISGEWHENHHDYPHLAHSGLKWWQVDLPNWIILAMKCCGMVSDCNSRLPAAAFKPSELSLWFEPEYPKLALSHQQASQ